eukprot:CAMPEP_0115066030 /NCGR_PEP_ID=MMETSP0227-20121206/10583_1 /TAXON_ID=89957 /ORGANISM="Polarella glacialis, Strain CCMP 1383" /LENGTH=394 /DNA_ID=CAMNT_0002451891 /DNA_START=90 /DNA_END=1274 /DNA_ORIENTATION=-
MARRWLDTWHRLLLIAFICGAASEPDGAWEIDGQSPRNLSADESEEVAASTNLTSASTATTTRTTTSVACPLPAALNSSQLDRYAGCLRDHCQEMSAEIMTAASEGGCWGNASAQVPLLQMPLQVSDLCGPLCPGYCNAVLPAGMSKSTSARQDPSLTQSTINATTQDWPRNRNQLVPNGTASLTMQPTPVPFGAQRVLVGAVVFRVSQPPTFFSRQSGVTQALRDGVAASLQVSPAKVVILEIGFVSTAAPEQRGPAEAAPGGTERGVNPTSGAVPGARRLRRMRQLSSQDTARVPFEIFGPPRALDADKVMSASSSMQAHLRQLLTEAGVIGEISDLSFEEPQVEHRLTHSAGVVSSTVPARKGLVEISAAGSSVTAMTLLTSWCFFTSIYH